MKTAYLHSQSSHGPTYLFQLIDNAIFILSRKSDYSSVVIVLHPPSGLHSLSRMCDVIFKPKFYLKHAALFIDSLLNVFNNILKASLRMHYPYSVTDGFVYSNSVFNSLRKERRDSIELKCKAGSIYIIKSEYCKFWSLPYAYLNSLIEFSRVWRSFWFRNNLNHRSILDYRHNKVLIGDLICSTSLRLYPQCGGALVKNNMIKDCIFSAISICRYVDQKFSAPLKDVFACSPEPCYLNSIYKRLLHSKGASIVDLSLTGRQEIYNSNDILGYPKVVPAEGRSEQLSPDDFSLAQRYIESRVNGKLHLWYMYNGRNNTDSSHIFTIDGSPLVVDNHSSYALVFLHSFDDGQYYFGVDSGFLDLYEWTIFTIETLLNSSKYDIILIKQHPSTHKRCPGDYLAFHSLLSRYKDHHKVVFIDKATPPKTVTLFENIVGITHHGSVAEELSYLGIPVIGSICAPWSLDYKFLVTWSTKKDYKEALEAMRAYSSSEIESIRSELFRYIYDYRLTSNGLEFNSTWCKYCYWIFDKKVSADNISEYYSIVERDLEKLTVEELENNGFLDMLADFHISNFIGSAKAPVA